MFSARLAVNTAISVAVLGSMLITGVEFTNDLVYQTPKGDLILLVEKKLQGMGLSQAEIATFSHNTAIPLSLQVAAVTDLEGLGDIPGRRVVAVALSNVLTEYQGALWSLRYGCWRNGAGRRVRSRQSARPEF